MSIDVDPDILKELQAERYRDAKRAEPWRVQVHVAVEDVLEMVRQGRSVLSWPYPDRRRTQHFFDLTEALEYAFIVQLAGQTCDIINNQTGKIYGAEA